MYRYNVSSELPFSASTSDEVVKEVFLELTFHQRGEGGELPNQVGLKGEMFQAEGTK